ncbi:MAG: hypothetical protein HQK51_04675 [Oligoflexia bacterium]|nr:hypothetical protein [Oligoflexia bacterium]
MQRKIKKIQKYIITIKKKSWSIISSQKFHYQYFTLIVILINFSCSYFEPKEINFDPQKGNSKFDPTEELNKFKKNFYKMCFNGTGKGRIVLNEETYRFGFDSRLNLNNTNWTLIFFFPLHKEERLILNWNNINNSKNQKNDLLLKESNFIQVQGSLAQKLSELKQQQQDTNYPWLELIWPTMGHFFKFYNSKEFNKCIFDQQLSEQEKISSGVCEYFLEKKIHFKWKNSNTLLETKFEIKNNAHPFDTNISLTNNDKNKKNKQNTIINNLFIIIKGFNVLNLNSSESSSTLIDKPCFDYLTIKIITTNSFSKKEFEFAKIDLLFEK